MAAAVTAALPFRSALDARAAALSCHWARVTKEWPRMVPGAHPPKTVEGQIRAGGSRSANRRARDLTPPSLGDGTDPDSAAYDPSVDRSSPSVAQSASDVSGALAPRTAELSADIYDLIVEQCLKPVDGLGKAYLPKESE